MPQASASAEQVLAVEQQIAARRVRSVAESLATNRCRLEIGFCDGCEMPSRDPMRSIATVVICYHSPHEGPTAQEVRRRDHALDKELKTELPKEIKRARELGDLRENAEYQAAKERQRLVESRISMLKKRVSEISLMNLDRIPHDKVGFGSTVHLKDAATAQRSSISS